jgi:hypothetical protein
VYWAHDHFNHHDDENVDVIYASCALFKDEEAVLLATIAIVRCSWVKRSLGRFDVELAQLVIALHEQNAIGQRTANDQSVHAYVLFYTPLLPEVMQSDVSTHHGVGHTA